MLTVCKNVNPKNCSFPEIPANGGLICLTMEKTRYCKPMCNKGYDFDFLRKSRLYEKCGDSTNYSWTTQYIGGNKLASCSASSSTVSGGPTVYFPKRCSDVSYNHNQEKLMISTFQTELSADVSGKLNTKTMCLLCGD
uniref:uncharacterized protein n=1 Tax=Pristiophorus japonicus TaxID=55135 RepID=UPI00398F2665